MSILETLGRQGPFDGQLFNLEFYLFLISGACIACLVYCKSSGFAQVGQAMEIIGGIACAATTILPIMCYPVFFPARGEIMLATVPLSLLAFPFVVYGAIKLLHEI